MNKYNVIATIFIMLLFSCDDNAMHSEVEFTVVVESQADISCGLPVVRFVDKLYMLKAKTSSDNLSYNAYKLEANLSGEGNRLKIKFVNTAPQDLRPCRAIGIWYPPITITSARQID